MNQTWGGTGARAGMLRQSGVYVSNRARLCTTAGLACGWLRVLGQSVKWNSMDGALLLAH